MTMDHERVAQAPGPTSPSRDEAHTALIVIPPPWTSDTDDLGTWISSDAYPQPIAKMGACTLFDAKQHAALIVRAVNSHADLVGALRFILAFYEPGQRHLDTEAWKCAEASGRAALAKAES